jgi:hypothetical protein
VEVRANAAVALARMEATAQVPQIERFFTPDRSYTLLTDACGWALVQLAGRPPYRPKPVEFQQFGWFLESLDD